MGSTLLILTFAREEAVAKWYQGTLVVLKIQGEDSG